MSYSFGSGGANIYDRSSRVVVASVMCGWKPYLTSRGIFWEFGAGGGAIAGPLSKIGDELERT